MYLQDTKLSRLKSILFYALLPVFVMPTVAVAEGLLITPYLGYRVGGEFTDAFTGTELKLAEGDAYGLIISKDRGNNGHFEFLYSLQPTNLTARGPVTSGVMVDVDVENYLFASKKTLDKELGTFMSGIVGVTRFNPRSTSLGPETRFALGLSGGLDYRINKNLGIRLEGRGIATLLDSDGGIFCSSGGCSVIAESDILLQFEFVTGFTFRF